MLLLSFLIASQVRNSGSCLENLPLHKCVTATAGLSPRKPGFSLRTFPSGISVEENELGGVPPPPRLRTLLCIPLPVVAPMFPTYLFTTAEVWDVCDDAAHYYSHLSVESSPLTRHFAGL